MPSPTVLASTIIDAKPVDYLIVLLYFAVVLGIGLPQLATPLARLFSPDLLAMSQWRMLYLFELGLALLSFAGVAWLRLPPTTRRQAFEPIDFLTFLLYGISMALFAAVLGLGRIVYAGSSAQLADWLDEVGAPLPPVRTLPINEIVPGVAVEGPHRAFAERLREMHHRRARARAR